MEISLCTPTPTIEWLFRMRQQLGASVSFQQLAVEGAEVLIKRNGLSVGANQGRSGRRHWRRAADAVLIVDQ